MLQKGQQSHGQGSQLCLVWGSTFHLGTVPPTQARELLLFFFFLSENTEEILRNGAGQRKTRINI